MAPSLLSKIQIPDHPTHFSNPGFGALPLPIPHSACLRAFARADLIRVFLSPRQLLFLTQSPLLGETSLPPQAEPPIPLRLHPPPPSLPRTPLSPTALEAVRVQFCLPPASGTSRQRLFLSQFNPNSSRVGEYLLPEPCPQRGETLPDSPRPRPRPISTTSTRKFSALATTPTQAVSRPSRALLLTKCPIPLPSPRLQNGSRFGGFREPLHTSPTLHPFLVASICPRSPSTSALPPPGLSPMPPPPGSPP